MVEVGMKFWNWLNGKKTVIGGVLLFVATVMTQAAVPVAPWIIMVIQYSGEAILGTGLVHKAVK
jgi:hypothetical protein